MIQNDKNNHGLIKKIITPISINIHEEISRVPDGLPVVKFTIKVNLFGIRILYLSYNTTIKTYK